MNDWEDYWKVGPASDAQVRSAEQYLRVRFPSDFVDLMKSHQGMIPPARWLPLFPKPPKVKFGPLMHLVEGRPGSIIRTLANLRVGGYPDLVVPFSGSGSQTHFALDYRSSSEAPTVVYATLEFGYDDPDVFRVVAQSISELIGRLENET